MLQRYAVDPQDGDDRGAGGRPIAAGRRSLTDRLAARPIQRRATTAAPAAASPQREPAGDPFWFADGGAQEVADRGVAAAASPLPHLATIQASFGRHDVTGARAEIGGAGAEAADQLGAEAYATGDRVAFARRAGSLHTAAHEAAHVVQQRGGVQLLGGLGAADDEHERHADEVAARVVAGHSAEDLLDHYAGGLPEAGVQRLVRIGKVPKRATRQQELAIDKILDLLAGPVGSGPLSVLLSYLTTSTRSHLHIEFETIEEDAPVHGQTGIFLGGHRHEESVMLQEAALVDPAPLLAGDCSLVVSVRIFLGPNTPAHEVATTILHELELHAVPAGLLLQRLEFVRTKMGNDAERILGMILQYLAKADDHRNLDRLIDLVESGRQVYQACKQTSLEKWALGTLRTICEDAQEQLVAVALKSPEEKDLERIDHLTNVVKHALGQGEPSGPKPEGLSAPHPYRTVTTAKDRTLDEKEVVEFFLSGVRDRRAMEVMVEELGTTYGVPRHESIALFNREVAPLLFAEAPSHKDFELLMQFMESYGVPPPVVMDLYEKHGGKRDEMDDEKPSRFKLPPPRERAFFTDEHREPDWTPITNHYVPRSVLEAHAELPPRTWIVVDGYQMRVYYTDKSGVRGASKVTGSDYGKYMVLRFEVRGG
jgi:hypothetical protein